MEYAIKVTSFLTIGVQQGFYTNEIEFALYFVHETLWEIAGQKDVIVLRIIFTLMACLVSCATST